MATETTHSTKGKAEPKAPPAEAEAKKDQPSEKGSRTDQAYVIVRRNALWALGVGLVPMPIVDFLGVTSVQIKMLKELSNLYDVPFFEHTAKKLISSLIAGLGSAGIGTLAAVSLMKFVPFIGQSLGAVAMPATGAAITHATGKIFVMHYESGGTLFDFDAKALRSHFREEFERAKEAMGTMKAEEQKKEAGTATA